MPDILVISSGVIHPPLLGRFNLWRGLSAFADCRLRHVSSVEALTYLSRSRVDALVLYFHRQRISNAALEALDRYVREGGGLLAVHSATASFKQLPHYGEILGGHFREHPPVGELAIRPTEREDGLFAAIPPFVLRDEAYRHDLRPGIRVHFLATPVNSEETVPFVWTRQHGAGRVCYVGAGHVAASLRHPGIVAILQQGLIWVSGAEGGQ